MKTKDVLDSPLHMVTIKDVYDDEPPQANPLFDEDIRRIVEEVVKYSTPWQDPILMQIDGSPTAMSSILIEQIVGIPPMDTPHT